MSGIMYLMGWTLWSAVFLAYFQSEGAYLGVYGSEITLMNIDKIWALNITGRNVVVAVVDDGVSYKHEDLKPNYEKTVSYDFVSNDNSPMPNGQMTHGTKCAGIIAARFRGKCRTGVAYNAKIAGIKIFDGTSPNENRTANGFQYKQQRIAIYSNSWGPSDNGYFIKGPGRREREALEQGVNHGRGGFGSIFVFSSGNGGLFGDSCAFDGYVNNINTIAIGPISKNGKVPRYAERCSSVMAAAYGDNVKTCTGSSSQCAADFGRTSAAAAFASGIIALLLEANNKLTQRDVQHLIIRTSNPRRVNIDQREWSVNGAGLLFHPAVGFGVINAEKLVDVARSNWTTVSQRRNCSTELNNLPKRIFRGGTNFSFAFEEENECFKIVAIEHVEVEVSLNFSPRAVMEMYVISPHGTKSQLLYMRMFDTFTARTDYKGLIVTSLHFWGENPSGKWTVLFKSAESMSSHGRSYGTLHGFKVTIYGSEEDPLLYSNILPKGTVTCGGKNKIWRGYGSHCCGSLWMYDQDYERCCVQSDEIVEKYPKCGSETYNKCEKICCDGVLFKKFQINATMACCGKRSYDRDNQICCNARIYAKYVCKNSWWPFRRYRHERRCSDYGGIRLVNTWKSCKKIKLQKKLCEDKQDYCHDFYCVSDVSQDEKRENCAKKCGFC